MEQLAVQTHLLDKQDGGTMNQFHKMYYCNIAMYITIFLKTDICVSSERFFMRPTQQFLHGVSVAALRSPLNFSSCCWMQVAIPTIERHRRLIVSAVAQKKATQRPPFLFTELGLTNDVVQ
jgi:hypothetical protein